MFRKAERIRNDLFSLFNSRRKAFCLQRIGTDGGPEFRVALIVGFVRDIIEVNNEVTLLTTLLEDSGFRSVAMSSHLYCLWF
nr:hypothetical protein [Mucilaginibacter sp. FT3.2]